jgi:ankyrin repeat protein
VLNCNDEDLLNLLSEEIDKDWLIADGLEFVSPSEERVSVLAVAVSTGNLKTVQILVTVLTDLDIDRGYTHEGMEMNARFIRQISPLQLACARGLFDIVFYLLDNGSSPDLCGLYSQKIGKTYVHVDNGTPPLLIAANSRFHNSYLIIEGLKYATAYSQEEVEYFKTAQVLLAHNANPNINSNDPTYPTPIFYTLGNPVLLSLLIENGADVNMVNDKEQTPL